MFAKTKKPILLKKVGILFFALLLAFVAVACRKVAVEEIKLSETDITLAVGDTKTITATVLPENASDTTIEWSSDKETIVTVEDGKIEALAVGTAKVTAAIGEVTATVNVTVAA